MPTTSISQKKAQSKKIKRENEDGANLDDTENMTEQEKRNNLKKVSQYQIVIDERQNNEQKLKIYFSYLNYSIKIFCLEI